MQEGVGALGVQAGWGALGSGALRRAGFWWVLVSSGEFWWGAFSPLEPIRTYRFFCVRCVQFVHFVHFVHFVRSVRSVRPFTLFTLFAQ